MNSEKSQISWNLNPLKQEVPTADLDSTIGTISSVMNLHGTLEKQPSWH